MPEKEAKPKEKREAPAEPGLEEILKRETRRDGFDPRVHGMRKSKQINL